MNSISDDYCPHGFMLFIRGSNPVPCYNDSDLYLGTLNITEQNYERNGPGIVVFNYRIRDLFIEGEYNDPVVN